MLAVNAPPVPPEPVFLSEGIRALTDTLLEFAAAWAPFDEPNASYKKAREQVEKAITARKNLRDFEPWTKQRGNVPKSSLDGARETVLKNPKIEPRDTKLARKYRIRIPSSSTPSASSSARAVSPSSSCPS